MTKKESRELINNIEKIAKRSKHIKVEGIQRWFDYYRIDLRVSRESTSVVKELYSYLSSVCPFIDDERNRGEKEYPSIWFYSYDDSILNDFDEDEYYFEINVMLW